MSASAPSNADDLARLRAKSKPGEREPMNVQEQGATHIAIGPNSRVDVLVAAIGRSDFERGIYDPCCSVGALPTAAIALGFQAMGSDIVDRPKVGSFRFTTRNFLEARLRDGWPAIIMRPPSKLTRRFIAKALLEVRQGGVVAALVPTAFLATTQKRHDLIERVIVLPGRGSAAWLIFRAGGRSAVRATIEWTS